MDPVLVERHIMQRIVEALTEFSMPVPAIHSGSRFREDLGLEDNTTPQDVLFEKLVEDFGWPLIQSDEEQRLRTVYDLVRYFLEHYGEGGEVVARLT
jgi:hypothetical protein